MHPEAARERRASLGKAFIEYSSKGQLVPDEITVELWRVSIRRFIDSHQFKPEVDFLVLDGIPRNVCQAELMDSFLDVTAIFYLRCSDREAVVSRLKKRAVTDNRLDDANETVIRQRLETYERKTQPLLNHYNTDRIVEVDALKSPIEVLGAIVSKVIGYQAQIPCLHHDKSSTSTPFVEDQLVA